MSNPSRTRRSSRAKTFDRDAANNTDDAVTTVTPNADLRIVKSGAATIDAGQNITYTIVVTNDGVSDAQSVSISDALPAQTTFVALTQTAGPAFTCSTPLSGANGTVTCTAAELAADASATFELRAAVAPNATGSLDNTVTVSSTTPDDDPSDNASTSTAAIGASADVSVDKSGPATIAAGDTLTYTITVANNGPSNAATVELNDVVPAQTTFVSLEQTSGPLATCTSPTMGGTGTVTCTFATLNAGASATFSLEVAVPANASGSIDNTATVTTATADPDGTDNSDTATTAIAASADVAATKTGPASATAGTTITYTLTAANNGPSDATNVTLADGLPAGTTFAALVQNSGPAFSCTTPAIGANGTITCTLATFDAGATAMFSLDVNIGPNVTAPIDNTLTIGSNTADPTPANNSDTESTPVNASADLAVTKIGPASATAGTTITYALTAANNGPSSATNVTLTDVLPAGTTFAALVQNSGPAFTCTTPAVGANGTITCTITTLNAGDTATFSLDVNVRPNVTAPIDNTLTIGSVTADPAPANNSDTESTPVSASADVTATKTGPASATAGTTITYMLTVANNGPSNAANVTVTDVLPAGTTFVRFVQNTGTGFDCTTPAVGTNGTINCTLPNVTAGESALFTLEVNVASNVTAPIDNTLTISTTTADPAPANNSDTETTPVAVSANVSAIKSAPASATAGTNITYTLLAFNNGPSDATNVTLTDVLPAQTTFVSIEQNAGPTFNCTGGSTVTCTIATLPRDTGGTFTLVVQAAPSASGTISNTATVSATTADPEPESDDSTATTMITGSADVRVLKSGPAAATAGTNVTYTIAVTNDGPSDSQNVTLTDVIPAQTTLVSATQTAGPTFTCTSAGAFTCTIATLANGATATFEITLAIEPGASGTISNTAQAIPETFDANAPNNQSTVTTTIAASADLAVTKTAPATATAGTNITYTIVLANNGPSNATNVLLSDVLPAQTSFVAATQTAGPAFICSGTTTVNCSASTFAAGASATFSIEVQLRPDASGAIVNTATVTSPTPDPDNANNTSTAPTTLTAAADVSVTKTAPAGATAGSPITYTVVVANNGPSNAATVTFTDVLPPQTTFVALTQSGGPAFTCTTGSTITCTIATLPATTATTFTIEALVSASASGAIDNTATVTSATPDPDSANNTSTVTTPLGNTADLAVTKTAPAAATEGSNITYTVTATNNGPSDAMNVVLTDVLPVDTTFVSATQTAGPAFTCTTPAVGANGTITCTAATFAAASTATFSFVVSITPGSNGPVQNTATLTSDTPDPTPANSAGTASTAIATASTDLSIVKTANSGNYNPGASATYTIVVTNNGPATATGTTVTDVLPAGTTLTSATSTQGTCSGTSTVTCNVGTLAPNATATITLIVTLPTTPGTIQNTATVSSDQGELTPANNTSSTTIAIIPASPAGIPTLSPLALALMAMAMAMTVMLLLRAR